MEQCIFCKIVEGKAPSYKIYEDKEFMAFLDIYPNTKGVTIVIPKKHYSSYVFDMPEDVYLRFMSFSKKVAKLLDKKLGVKRTAMVLEGLGIDHAHIKLYPLHGLSKKFKEIIAKEIKYFDKYEGYLTTLLGPRAKDEALKELAKKIRE